jgi:hypothetical protein
VRGSRQNNAGLDRVVEATGPTTNVTLDGSGPSDPDGDVLTFAWSEAGSPIGTPVALTSPTVTDLVEPSPALASNAPETFPLGTTDVTWTATDAIGNTSTKIQKVTVVAGGAGNQLGNLRKPIVHLTETGAIDPQVTPSLTAKVEAASAAVARGNPNDAKAALGELKALANCVEAQADKKTTREAANKIIGILGG